MLGLLVVDEPLYEVTPSVGSVAVVEVVGDYLNLVVDGSPRPIGPLQRVRVYLGDRCVGRFLYVPEEDTLEDRVWRLVVKLGSTERPVAVNRVLGVFSGLVVGEKHGAVDGLVSGYDLVRDSDGSGLRAPQSPTGQRVCLLHLSKSRDAVAECKKELGPTQRDGG